MTMRWIRSATAWLVAAWTLLAPAGAEAVCLRNVADRASPLRHLASLRPAALERGEVSIGYVGHSTFLIETAEGVRIATDYNDYVRPQVVPDIVTMNIAHSTHFSRNVPPGVKHVLNGWGTPDRPAEHDLVHGDVQVRNVTTNIREGGGTYQGGNSIFVFETAGLCIAHLGHLHHRLTPEHMRQLGHIDVMFVPIDGTWTLGQELMLEVVEQVGAQVIVPMHYFGEQSLMRFIDKLVSDPKLAYQFRFHTAPTLVYSRATLPPTREIVVLRGRF